MNIKQGLSAPTYALIGMDFFSPGCPDLRTFKRLLLTGKADTNITDLENWVNQTLSEQGIKKTAKAGLNSAEQKLALVLLRALIDANLPAASEKIAIKVHIPEELSGSQGQALKISLSKIAEKCDLNIITSQSAVNNGNFSADFENGLLKLPNSKAGTVALCGFFAAKQSTKPEESSMGLGCVLLSQLTKNETPDAYAQIVLEEKKSSDENGVRDHIEKYSLQSDKSENTNDSGYSQGIQYAPIAKLMKCALSLNNATRFPNGIEIKDKNVERMMRPWFPLPYTYKRECLLSLPASQNGLEHIRLEKDYQDHQHSDQPFDNFGLYLLPLAFDQLDEGLDTIQTNLKKLKKCRNLADFTQKALKTFTQRPEAKYTLAVIGSSCHELSAELERALEALPSSFESGREWQTPAGSYFTPQPLGKEEKIAFVYPGAFGTYVGMGRSIFYLFPQLYEGLQIVSEDPGKTINEQVIFPPALTPELKEELQAELNNNPTEMISSGVCFSHLYTVILQDIFKIQPQAVFGYSLGENSMMFATGIWSQADGMRTSLEASPIFHKRVSGLQNAIREYWGMSTVEDDKSAGQPIWANYVLMAPVEKVREALKNEEHVYLTHINTPRQVVIGGEPQACQRFAKELKCMHLQAPYHHAIHCTPILSEFDDFARMHEWPVEYEPHIPVYSAANYAPLEYDSASIAESFARMLTHPIDFPQLVELAYQDGARIFIELGAGSNCSKWIAAILKGKPHASMSINQNNVEDHTSILKLVARLASQRVPLDLTALGGY